MARFKDLQEIIFDKMANFKRRDTVEFSATQLRAFEIINKKSAPKKNFALSKSHPAYKVLSAPNKRLTLSQQKAYKALNKGNKAQKEKETKQDFQKVLKILGIEL
tara:strand:+ start:100 stop:414 length:315 start_codon:yes stop_codon:yes gene_type:complete